MSDSGEVCQIGGSGIQKKTLFSAFFSVFSAATPIRLTFIGFFEKLLEASLLLGVPGGVPSLYTPLYAPCTPLRHTAHVHGTARSDTPSGRIRWFPDRLISGFHAGIGL